MALCRLAFLALLGFLVAQSDAFYDRKLIQSVEPINAYLEKIPSSKMPLFLTPYIDQGKLAEGRNLSEVTSLPGNAKSNLKSYSGYFTVNNKFDSNMFFWFFPALSGKTDVPVLLWLQGGPGASSMYGLFGEVGPIEVNSDLTWNIREHTWNKDFAIVFIDNPVGTGFSFTKDDKGYATNEVDVGRDLYEALRQFFTLFEEYRGNPFYLTGESYAGKYLPAIGHKIFKMGDEAKKAGINLQGLAIGDGLCDPRNMVDYGSYLYQIGLIDELQRDYFYDQQKLAVHYIDNRQFKKAFDVFDMLLNGDLYKQGSYFYNVTGLTSYYNFLQNENDPSSGSYAQFLGLPETRNAIHVGSLPFNDGNIVERHLVDDVMDTVKPWVEDLLNANYSMMFYSGQLDIIVAAPLTEKFLSKLNWKGAQSYKNASRSIYRVTPKSPVAGYVRHVENLYQVLIRGAGHMVPADQPSVAHDMITRFIKQTLY